MQCKLTQNVRIKHAFGRTFWPRVFAGSCFCASFRQPYCALECFSSSVGRRFAVLSNASILCCTKWWLYDEKCLQMTAQREKMCIFAVT